MGQPSLGSPQCLTTTAMYLVASDFLLHRILYVPIAVYWMHGYPSRCIGVCALHFTRQASGCFDGEFRLALTGNSLVSGLQPEGFLWSGLRPNLKGSSFGFQLWVRVCLLSFAGTCLSLDQMATTKNTAVSGGPSPCFNRFQHHWNSPSLDGPEVSQLTLRLRANL